MSTSRVHAPRMNALLWAGACGLCAHVLVVAWGAFMRERVPPLPRASATFAEIGLITLPERPEPPVGEGEANEDGGGSERAGREPVATGGEKAPAKPEPAAVAPPPKMPAKTVAPPPSDGEVESLEHGNADAQQPEDLFALDALLSEDAEAEPLTVSVKPKPAWRNKVTPATQAMSGKRARTSGHFGTGPGAKGGTGGVGSGRARGKGGSGAGVFGGASGAFVGNVCFVAPGTRSIRSMGSCRTEALVHTDAFNVPTTHFESGFPGISDRIEWFSILYRGGFEVSREGEYEFRLASDDGSILRIDGEVIVDNDGLHGPVAKRGKVQLSAGPHDLDLRYFQGPRTLVSLQLWVTPPGGSERLFGPSL